ncbi:MFS transporter [Alkalimarinus alittae]|uniref:MFS transporter n=1 Tax=Alkalimarinus alittae TaxID=2961619 RepID=A0ABY6MYB7_9ALTE|nr:MFS transporter [Alkalimarinus alittae]UZE94821.1 MFS transporter [Alkalimarinus alittae]
MLPTEPKTLPVFTVVLLSSLYFSQGLPSGFLAHALPALLREYGVAVEYIGLLKLLALPWFLKFLWAPFVDRTEVARLGDQRGWILTMQSALALLILILSFFTPDTLFGSFIILFFLLVLMINTTAATQDIATDGLAVKLLPEKWRGLGNSIQVSGFKAGMILSGSLLLLSVDKLGWSLSFQFLSLCLFVLLVPSYLFKEPSENTQPKRLKDEHCSHYTSNKSSWFDAYRGFFSQRGIRYWLVVLFTYKVADALGSGMIKPLLVDLEFSLTAIAEITFWASICGLIAAVLAGFIYYRLGAKGSLLLFGLLQALGIAAYGVLAKGDLSVDVVIAVALFEQAADGMSTVALFALMMGQCRKDHEGSDFTVQACIQVVMSGLVGALSGFVAKFAGYTTLYMVAGLLGLLALIPVYLYFSNLAQRANANDQ